MDSSMPSLIGKVVWRASTTLKDKVITMDILLGIVLSPMIESKS